MNKAWYKSKMLWVSFLSIIGIAFFGKELPAQTVVYVLAGINFILRLVTKENIVWKE